MIKEFKDFALKGNVMGLAVGIIIGGAFGKIVSSFVSDVLMPPIGMLMGGQDFSDIKIKLADAKAAVMEGNNVISEAVPAVNLNIGLFINAVVDFLIIAFAIFMVVKAMNKMKKKEEAAPAAPVGPSNEEKLLMEIRDALKKQSNVSF
jgi:large conductance mechanosensitive channel